MTSTPIQTRLNSAAPRERRSRRWGALPCAAIVAGLWLSLAALDGSAGQNVRDQKVRQDKARFESDKDWIYNDFAAAVAAAGQQRKPIIAVLRCVPCTECVKLDDQLLEDDPELRELLGQFVRVRLISANGLDLSLFQFDYDQSFAVFLLNSDGTIYGRFGTRSHRTDWKSDVSVAGMKEALRAALALHAKYPANKKQLAAKRGPAPEFAMPEEFPRLKRYAPKLDYGPKLVLNCLHCHQIGEAILSNEFNYSPKLSDRTLFPYPHPKSLGLILDPEKCATVASVVPDSPAAAAGFIAGDAVESMNGQPLLSLADVQWVLHNTDSNGGPIAVQIVRDGKPLTIQWQLNKGWRDRDDISWRASAWELRRIALGGMQLEKCDSRPQGRPGNAMALRIRHVGQFAPHDIAKNAGFEAGRIVVSYDGRTDLLRETDVLVHGLRTHASFRRVPVELLSGAERFTLELPPHE
jgi:hypothetical protein